MSDTNAAADTPMPRPPTNLDRFKALVGDIARPFAVYAISGATAKAIWVNADPGVITAGGVIVIAIYGAKSLENGFQSRDAAKVETAKVQAAPPPPPPSADDAPPVKVEE